MRCKFSHTSSVFRGIASSMGGGAPLKILKQQNESAEDGQTQPHILEVLDQKVPPGRSNHKHKAASGKAFSASSSSSMVGPTAPPPAGSPQRRWHRYRRPSAIPWRRLWQLPNHHQRTDGDSLPWPVTQRLVGPGLIALTSDTETGGSRTHCPDQWHRDWWVQDSLPWPVTQRLVGPGLIALTSDTETGGSRTHCPDQWHRDWWVQDSLPWPVTRRLVGPGLIALTSDTETGGSRTPCPDQWHGDWWVQDSLPWPVTRRLVGPGLLALTSDTETGGSHSSFKKQTWTDLLPLVCLHWFMLRWHPEK